MNSKILVTGANGQLGNELRRLCVNYPGLEFIFTDADMLDITNPDAISVFMSASKPAIVVNCAAYTAVDEAEFDHTMARKVNSLAPQILATACDMLDAFLIHVSTDYVFDGEKTTPYTEDDFTNPISVYGMTKLEGEESIKNVFDKYIIIRTSWLYSSFGDNFVRKMIRLGKEREKISVISNQIGTPTYARDLAECIVEIIIKSVLNPQLYVPGIYNYSNEGECSWFEFAKAVHEIYGIQNCEIVPIKDVEYNTIAKRPRYSVLDKTKIKETFDIKIRDWRDSLESCLLSLNR